MQQHLHNTTRVYLDNAATTPLCEAARVAMEPYFARTFGNASSPYAVSRDARSAVDRARAQVAALIGAQSDEIVFTAGGTESDNGALWGVALANLEQRGHVIISAVEHPAVSETALALRELGFTISYAAANSDGVVSAEAVARRLQPDTLLVSVMAVNNEVGVCQPIAEVAALLQGHGVLLHTDAVQAAGKIAVDVGMWGVDLLSLSAHKFGGPKGVGALFVRRGVKLRSWVRGGAQERGRRAGTENVPSIVGMGAAAEAAQCDLESNRQQWSALRERLEMALLALGGTINGQAVPRAPHITSVALSGHRAESLALNLDLRGFAVGTGSACASGALEPSHVLTVMGLSQAAARASLRVSLGTQSTMREIEEFLTELTTLTTG